MAFTVGVGFTSPADAAIITTITPVLTMILAAFVLREMITGKKIIGVCASAIGAILLVSGSGGRAAASRETTTCWGTFSAWLPSAA